MTGLGLALTAALLAGLAGLCAYNAGNKCGPRGRRYAEAVLASARRWGG